MEISIIIPTLNESEYVGRLIDCLLSNLTITFEIIIVDGGSTDDTIAICQQRGVTVVESKPSRAIQQNLGAAHAQYEYLYFLHADTLPPSSLQADLTQCMKQGIIAACYRSAYETKSLILRVNAFFTRFHWLVARGGDQSLLIQKKAFFELGKFDETYVIMEEYPLIEQLMKKRQLTILPKSILISTRKYDNRSWFKVSRANYKAFRLFRKNVDSKTIKQVYKDALS